MSCHDCVTPLHISPYLAHKFVLIVNDDGERYSRLVDGEAFKATQRKHAFADPYLFLQA